MNGRLFRSRDDRMVAGVAGGLAAFLNIDPSLVRILWVVLIPLTGGLILLLYLAMAIIVPVQRFDDDRWRAWEAQSGGSWAPPDPTGSSDEPLPSTSGLASDPGAIASADALPADAAAASLVGSDATTTGDAMTTAFEPAAPGGPPPSGRSTSTPPAGSGPGWAAPPPDARPTWAPPPEGHHDRTAPLVFGLILVIIGGVFLARSYLPGIDWGLTWPILFVGIGIALVIGSVRRSSPR